MSREQYERERARLRRRSKDMEGVLTLNNAYRARRELYPQEDDRAIDLARRLGRERSRVNHVDIPECYIKK